MKKKINYKAFWMLPKADRKGITDSLLMDSGREIVSAQVGDHDYAIRTQGEVRIRWKDEIYRYLQDFPDELVKLIRKGKADGHPDCEVIENNWYELMVWDENNTLVYSDLIDIDVSKLTRKAVDEIIMETEEIFDEP